MIFPFGCYSITLTKWHDENPNDWVCIKSGRLGKKPIVYGRAEILKELIEKMKGRKGITYAKAWSLGIGKDAHISS